MKDFIDYIDKPDQFRQAEIKTLKKIFSGVIKESFFSNVYRRITSDIRFNNILINSINPKTFSFESLFFKNSINPLDESKMIAMCHYSNIATMSDSEKGKMQSDETYINKLINEVILMYRLKGLAAGNFSKTSLESYFPIIYYTSALNNYCGSKYDELFYGKTKAKSPYNTDFNYTILGKIIRKIKACIALVEVGALDDLIVIFRSLIELFMTFAALWDTHNGEIDAYLVCDRMSLEYNYGKELDNGYKKEAKRLKENPINVLNYGWIRHLNGYSNLEKEHQGLKLSALARILDEKYDYFCKNFGSDLYKIYKSCNSQTHGTSLSMHYLDLELSVFENIAVMTKFFSKIMSQDLFDFDLFIGDIDFVSELNRSLEQSRVIRLWLHDNETALVKTDLEYRNRFLCSLKMRE